MIMSWIGAGIVDELAQGAAGSDRKPSRHAKVHHKGLSGGQFSHEEFRPTSQSLNHGSGDALGKPFRHRKTQVRPVLNQVRNPASLHDRGQTAANRLDFGQFRHDEAYSLLNVTTLWSRAMPDDLKTENDSTETVSFGFEDVSPSEKTARVGGVFESVADRYDVMNDLMSAGIHRLWKADTLAKINPQPGETLYDIAGGTGDLAKRFIDLADRRARERRRPEILSRAIVCDINAAMLDAGKARRDMAPYEGRIDWVCGNAEALPFADRTADALTIAFGIRNVTYRDKALREFRRVLKPGGRLAILEFSHMTSGALQAAYDAYSFSVIPRMGGMVTGDEDSYRYLVESIRKFPRQDEFAREISDAGFSNVSVTNFTGGIASLHFAWAV